MTIQAYLTKQSKKIDKAMDGFLPPEGENPSELHAAMRYAVFSGGKRIRPILALAACEAVGGNDKKVLPAACALEFIHNYSLIHDDLPCMDDDDTRRGRPACHKKYSETTAVLAGDGLLTAAFGLLSLNGSNLKPTQLKQQLAVISLVAEAIGTQGMVGGQAVDVAFAGQELDLPKIELINICKTGALIAVSTRLGAILGGGTPAQIRALYNYGKYIGLVFQIVDDIIDKEGYARVLGVSEAMREAETLVKKAKRSLKSLGPKASVFDQLADFILNRNR